GGVGTRASDSGFDQGYDFPLQGALRHVFAENGPLTALSETLARDPIYPDPDRLVTFAGLHDTPRFASLAPDWALPLAYAFLFLTRGIPLIYYGDEIAMQGKDDPETRAHFPGGFPGDDRDAFTRAGRTPSENNLRSVIAWLADLRRRHPALSAGSRTMFVAAEEQRLAWVRYRKGTRPDTDGNLLCVLHRDPSSETTTLDGLGESVQMGKRSVGIWERRAGKWVTRAVVDATGVRVP
ncbi:MAG: alpha-amylase family glycosyl hydrolase, partial [Armatimonadaceae bacterium]